MAVPREAAAMRRAIALSAAGLGTTSPNPPVGCVLIGSGGQAIGEGYHEHKGEAHAETRALAAAGRLAEGATAVVTLEPCNHVGRTPACSEALIDARVGRVVIAVLDPTSRGAGGAAVLRTAGVDVEVGVLADEARVVLGPWLRALEARRPVVTWPYVLGSQGIGTVPEGMADVRAMRLGADAVLHRDGSVAEAIPGSHGAGILQLEGPPPGADPAAIMTSLYDGGVRCLLLAGGLDLAAPFLAEGLVDRVCAYLPAENAPQQSAAVSPWPLVPPGFAITAVARVEGFVRVEARRER
jgi:diaminohydroxyphosphoribosylaminopyrimidine deaminase/5-amino-6-(5-phosphoribosylamino)uracil reductase